jgi:hypothetical protein
VDAIHTVARKEVQKLCEPFDLNLGPGEIAFRILARAERCEL